MSRLSVMGNSSALRDLFYQVGFKVDDKGLKDADKGIDKLDSKLGSLGNKMQSIGSGMATIGAGLTAGVTLPLVAMVTKGVKAFSSYDDAMRQVWATTGMTEDEFKSLGELARDLGRNTKFSATEVANGMNYLGLAGWDTNQIMEATPGVLNLAAAAGMDLGRAADIVTDNMAAFGIETQHTMAVVDLLAQTQRKSNTSVDQLGEAYKTAGPTAASFNMNMLETNAILGTFANQGVKGSAAGTTFTAMFRDLIKSGGKAGLALGNSTIAIFDQNGALRDTRDIFGEIEEAMSGYSIQQRNMMLRDKFGEQGLRGMNLMLGAGSEGYNQLTQDLMNYSGAAAEMEGIMEGGIGGALRGLGSAVGGFFIEVGMQFEDEVIAIAELATNLTNTFANLDDDTKKNIANFAAGLAAMGPTMWVGGRLIERFGRTLTNLGVIWLALQAKIGAGTTTLGGMFSTLGAGMLLPFKSLFKLLKDNPIKKLMGKMLGSGFSLMGLIMPKGVETGKMITNPLTGGLMPELAWANKTIMSRTKLLFADIIGTATIFATDLVRVISKPFKPLFLLLGKVFAPLKALLTFPAVIFAGKFLLIAGVITAVSGIIWGLSKSFDHMKSEGAKFVGSFKRRWQEFGQSIKGPIEQLDALFKKLAEFFGFGKEYADGGPLNVFVTVAEKMITGFFNFLTWNVDNLFTVLSTLITILAPLFVAIAEMFMALWPTIKWIGIKIVQFVTLFVKAIAWGLQQVTPILVNIVDVFVNMANLIGSTITMFIGLFTGNWSMFLDGIKGMTSHFVDGITNMFIGLTNAIISTLNGLGKAASIIPGFDGWTIKHVAKRDSSTKSGGSSSSPLWNAIWGPKGKELPTTQYGPRISNLTDEHDDPFARSLSEIVKNPLEDINDGIGDLNDTMGKVGNYIRARKPYEFTQLDEHRRVVYIERDEFNNEHTTRTPESSPPAAAQQQPAAETTIINNEISVNVTGDIMDGDKVASKVKTVIHSEMVPAIEKYFSGLSRKAPSYSA